MLGRPCRPWLRLYTRDGTHVAGTGLSSLSCRFFRSGVSRGLLGRPLLLSVLGAITWLPAQGRSRHLQTSARCSPELPGAISVAPCCPCTVLARLWRHKALRGRVIHMICQACIRTYTQRANSSQPTSDVPACATRACSIHALGLLLLDWSRCRAIPEWL